MLTLHLDFQGKSTRVSLAGLPVAKARGEPISRTRFGEIRSHRLISGIRRDPGFNPGLDALVAGDPELALDIAGTAIDADNCSTAYFDPADVDRRPIGDFKDIDVVFDAEGKEKTRRPHLKRAPNLDDLHPVKVVKRLPLADALTQFVIKQTLQVMHVDGLTYDFLRGIAKDLAERGEAALLGAGAKGNLPLVLRESGTAYRAFLCGDIQADGRYKLLLLLSDQELKLPEGGSP